MKIVGFNLAETSYGLPLDNGGACLAIDGEIISLINEERLNRQQYSPGFKKSIDYILESNDLKIEDVDLFVASSCLEPQVGAEQVQNQLKENGFEIPVSKILICGHHLSHAFAGYYPSGFNHSLIMVLDGDGNTLTEKMVEKTENQEGFWNNENEHNSYYIGNGDNIELLERDLVGAGKNGFGGAYRYFTYFCGFPGYKYAGKLMGLSAYGAKRNTYKDIEIFELGENGKVKCLLPDSNRLNSPLVVEEWLASRGVDVKARNPDEPVSEAIEDIAFLIQRELDRALVHKVKYLVQKTGIKNLCISGGVGLNSVSNRTILDSADIENLFIQPAAGDSGQCLGNTYYGISQFDLMNLKRRPISVYQGKEYLEDEIAEVLETEKEKVIFQKLDFDELAKRTATVLSQDKIVGWFQGRSEIGPRALGNRSILASPLNANMKDIINLRVKHREPFRPFAPSVLEEKAREWFDIPISAPYMIMNAAVLQPNKIPAVTHEDGSARVQTVSIKQNAKYHELISEFERITTVPVVLNTSFNDNEAIVESPADALNTFLRTGIDYLCIGNYFVEKIKS